MGLFSKKEKKNEINVPEEKFELEDIFLIPLSEIPEKSKRDMASSIDNARKFLEENDVTMEVPVPLEDEKTGRIEFVRVNLGLPIKCKGEAVLWYRKIEEGVFNKTLRAYEAVTEYRCYFYDFKTQKIMLVPLYFDNDVIVTNQKRISESQREGNFVGLGARGTFVGSSGGISTSESQTFGDVNIMFEGEISFTFWGVADPNGLARLIKYVIKKSKEWNERITKQEKEEQKLENKEINCTSCNSPNSMEAKFCNKCGHKFTTICTKCKNVNPSDSSFCNQCGFTLQ